MLNHCVHCGTTFHPGKWWWQEIETKSRQCMDCGKVTGMVQTKQLKITAEVDGKQVPLETVSTETFEAIKALEKPKEIPVPVARIGNWRGSRSNRRLFLKLTRSVINYIGTSDDLILAIDPKDGIVAACWSNEKDKNSIVNYENVEPL